MFFNRHYFGVCLQYRKSCGPHCGGPTKNCPEYTPDFVKLAESYGAKGIRVTDETEIAPAFEFARRVKNVPTVIEFMIDRLKNS